MNRLDDDDLITRLRAGIDERQSGVAAPEGIADGARRRARRRTATRAVGVGVPVLAAAGAATVLATSGSSASSPGGSTAGGAVAGHDASYVLARVKARFAHDAASAFTINDRGYRSGTVDANGTISALGTLASDSWDYTAPDGTLYTNSAGIETDGTPTGYVEYWWVYPAANGTQKFAQTVIDNNDHTYSQSGPVHTGLPADAPADEGQPVVGLGSSAPQVQQALQSGELTEKGTTTLDGTSVIALSTRLSSSTPEGSSFHLTLYVDAQSYQPVRLVSQVTGNPALFIEDYEPASADNIARAEDSSIPSGYTKVANAGVGAAAREAASGRPAAARAAAHR